MYRSASSAAVGTVVCDAVLEDQPRAVIEKEILFAGPARIEALSLRHGGGVRIGHARIIYFVRRAKTGAPQIRSQNQIAGLPVALDELTLRVVIDARVTRHFELIGQAKHRNRLARSVVALHQLVLRFYRTLDANHFRLTPAPSVYVEADAIALHFAPEFARLYQFGATDMPRR